MNSQGFIWEIHIAIFFEFQCMHWLLWHGAEINKQSKDGWTPAHVAAIRGRSTCMQVRYFCIVQSTLMNIPFFRHFYVYFVHILMYPHSLLETIEFGVYNINVIQKVFTLL